MTLEGSDGFEGCSVRVRLLGVCSSDSLRVLRGDLMALSVFFSRIFFSRATRLVSTYISKSSS